MNGIKKVITEKYGRFKSVTPSDEILENWGVHIKTWNKWVDNDKDPDLDQLALVADFLECDIQDLLHLEPVRS
jgi:hypothetical protein